MADSKEAATVTQGIITAGMAFRVKYRVKTDMGVVLRRFCPIQSLGVHPKNRGGVYPSGLRCKSLSVDVVDEGFSSEECNYAGVAVEERPQHLQTPDYVDMRTFNITSSSADELLTTCFSEPYDDVRLGTLSHSHLMVVLRAYMTKAKWDVPDSKKTGIVFCDAGGRLSITAVAEHENGRPMLEVSTEGLMMEILSWKMDKEEPSAASTISQALNKGHALALKTTELTAMAVLNGEVIAQMSKDVGQQVAYQTVREAARAQLGSYVDEQDFVEMFHFLLHTGAGNNTFVDDLLQFGSKFVDSKLRVLRLGAFAQVNKITDAAPRTKIAVLKRAYRSMPKNGICQSPETDWGKIPWEMLSLLEQLLTFFHVHCKPYCTKHIQPQSRIDLFYANVDQVAASAFYETYKQGKPKAKQKDVIKAMLDATVVYVEQIGGKQTLTWIKFPEEYAWIDYDLDGRAKKAKDGEGVVGSTSSSSVDPRVLRFDETSGKQITDQVDFSKAAKASVEVAKVPWREWRAGAGCAVLGQNAADMAASVAVLQHLHESYPVEDEPIDIEYKEGSGWYVVATEDTAAGGVWLPPCVPQRAKVSEETEHPSAVKLTVSTMDKPYVIANLSNDEKTHAAPTATKAKMKRAASQTAVAATGAADAINANDNTCNDSSTTNVRRTAHYYVTTEFKIPSRVKGINGRWTWCEASDESMNPFWAVRRLTQTQLTAESKESVPRVGRLKPRFNCKLEAFSISNTIHASPRGTSMNLTRAITVMFLTNSTPLLKGEELILEVIEKPKKEQRGRDWRDALKERQRAAAAAAAATDAPGQEAKKKRLG